MQWNNNKFPGIMLKFHGSPMQFSREYMEVVYLQCEIYGWYKMCGEYVIAKLRTISEDYKEIKKINNGGKYICKKMKS